MSYTVPKVDVLVSAILRSQANVQPGADVATNGASRSANFLMSAAQFQAATGRPLRTGVTTETVNLLLPGQIYGERVNNLDMRVCEDRPRQRDEGERRHRPLQPDQRQHADDVRIDLRPGVQGERWLRPTAVLQPRFVRFNVQFDF